MNLKDISRLVKLPTGEIVDGGQSYTGRLISSGRAMFQQKVRRFHHMDTPDRSWRHMFATLVSQAMVRRVQQDLATLQQPAFPNTDGLENYFLRNLLVS